MANYNSIEEMMNSTANMERLLNAVNYTDETYVVKGVDWFSFNGKVASSIYVNGRSWIGLGESSEQLLVCNLKGMMKNLYREEGTICEKIKVLKIRWEGYSQPTAIPPFQVNYEWFFISNGDMFLNIIYAPMLAAYLGTTKVNDPINETFSIATSKSTAISFYSIGKGGTSFRTEMGPYAFTESVPDDSTGRKYLIMDSEDNIYTISDGELISHGAEYATAQLFKDIGMDELPDAQILLSLEYPMILCWQESDEDVPIIKARMRAAPPPQVVYSKNNVMIDSSILGIEKVEAVADENTLFAFSFDGGETWKAYINNKWATLSEETSGMNYETLESIGTDAWEIANETNQYMVRFTLFEGGYVEKITIYYLN